MAKMRPPWIKACSWVLQAQQNVKMVLLKFSYNGRSIAHDRGGSDENLGLLETAQNSSGQTSLMPDR